MSDRRLRRWAAALLRLAIRDDDRRATILGDLVEELGPADGRTTTDLRYLSAAAGLALAYGLLPRWRAAAAPAVGRAFDEALRAARRLRRRPLYVALFTLTLALAVGANVLLLGILNGVLIRPLPFADGGALRQVMVRTPSGDVRAGASMRDVLDLERAPGVAAVAGWHRWDPAVSGPRFEPERLHGLAVTPGYFELFSIEPALGRTFTREGADATGFDDVVLSYGYWRRAAGGDPGVLGRSLRLNGRDKTVIGVGPPDLPRDLPGMGPVDFWARSEYASAPRASLPSRSGADLVVGFRLDPGTDPGRAARVIHDAIRLDPAEEATPGIVGRTFLTPTLRAVAVGSAGRVLLFFQVAMAGVWLIAVANLAGVLVSGLVDRRDELAVRAALGADRSRVAAMVLTETAMLATLGGAAGLTLATAGLPGVVALAGDAIPAGFNVGIDGIAVAAAAGLTAVSALVLGAVPALVLAGRLGSLVPVRSARSGATGGSLSLRTAFAAVQIAASFVIVVSAVVLARSFVTLDRSDTGVDGRVLAMNVQALSAHYPDRSSQQRLYAAILARVLRVEGVAAAASINGAPLSAASLCINVRPRDDSARSPTSGSCAELRAVLAGLFRHGRHVAGAGPGPHAYRRGGPRRGCRRERGGRESAVAGAGPGRAFSGVRTPGRSGPRGRCRLRRHRARQPRGAVHVRARVAMARQPQNDRRTAATRRAPGSGKAVRSAIRDDAPNVPIDDLGTLEGRRVGALTRERFRAAAMSGTGIVTLLLALLGVYGVVESGVEETLRDLAVRRMLGAREGLLVASLLGHVAAVVAMGIGLGLAGALVAGEALSAAIVGVAPFDPFSLAGTAAAFLCLSLLAAAPPALRITRIDPLTLARSP